MERMRFIWDEVKSGTNDGMNITRAPSTTRYQTMFSAYEAESFRCIRAYDTHRLMCELLHTAMSFLGRHTSVEHIKSIYVKFGTDHINCGRQHHTAWVVERVPTGCVLSGGAPSHNLRTS